MLACLFVMGRWLSNTTLTTLTKARLGSFLACATGENGIRTIAGALAFLPVAHAAL
jgi:hypothetical protein